MTDSTLAIARACLQAYVDKDRAAIEKLIADDFHFTSPLDNRLDRATYFERCWPNSTTMQTFKSIYEAEQGGRAFLVYEASTTNGKAFRNCEVYQARDGKLVQAEVYFGWDLPHKAALGGFV